MKKLVTVLTVAAMLFSSFAFAIDGTKVNARIKAAFSNDFSAASDVSWEKLSDFYFAKFLINNIELKAAYNEEGELVGTSRSIESSLLPVSISLALDKKYAGYTFSQEALELTYNGETSYYLSVSNDRQVLKLKCSFSGNIDVVGKIKRK
jgi:hypothetical protein